MAWAEKLPSGRFRGVYRDVDGTRRSAGTYSRKAEAVREAADLEVDQRKPGAIRPDAGKLTWGTWADQWWPRRRVEDSTRHRDESRLRHLRRRWDRVPLADITRETVEDWVMELAAHPGRSPSTVQRIYHLFSASMTAAVVARKLATSPCVAIPLERAPLPDEAYLTQPEVDAAVFHMRRRYRILTLLAAYTGLRWGELVGLHRQRVDLDAGRVDVVLAWDTKNHRYKPPKDHERRSVPLPDWLVDDLDAWFAEFDENGAAQHCGVPHPQALRSRCSSGLVVPGLRGVPIDYDSFRRNHWAPAVGMLVWTDGTDAYPTQPRAREALGPDAQIVQQWQPGLAGIDHPVTIHSLRHSYASWLIQAGMPIEAVSKLLGHASVLTTARYTHFASGQWDGVRSILTRPEPEGFAPRLPSAPAATDHG